MPPRDTAADGPEEIRRPRPSLPALVLGLPVRFYRAFISPLTPPMCRFTPTCSAYALEALAVHGIWKGGLLTAWRLLRCQPLCKGGYDPVPPPSPARRARTMRAAARRRARALGGDLRPWGLRVPRPPGRPRPRTS
ncbi:MAG: membrane protein insertion efficiency factor YidD [Deltaproteobacteria bacterium]|nr:membrane protein insertion efficiency factor YidD [Deltaproteobacteria bacterium]